MGQLHLRSHPSADAPNIDGDMAAVLQAMTDSGYCHLMADGKPLGVCCRQDIWEQLLKQLEGGEDDGE